MSPRSDVVARKHKRREKEEVKLKEVKTKNEGGEDQK